MSPQRSRVGAETATKTVAAASADSVGHITADIAVVGAGPAGLAAATRAAEAGKRVVVIDEGLRAGGQIWRHGASARAALPTLARRWIERFERSGASLLSGASVVDVSALAAGDGFAIEAEYHGTRAAAPRYVRAGAVIIATGARERFLPFPRWTLPGVIGVGGAQALLKMGTSFAGKRVVIGGSGPLLLPVAASLARAGARVTLVAEQASPRAVAAFAAGLWRSPATLLQAARYRAAFLGARYRTGTWVARADGDGRVREVTVTDGRASRTLACDVLCTGYGLVPSTELARLAGCATAGGAVVVGDGQETSVRGVYCAGEPTGIGGVHLSLVEGEIAGLRAAGGAREAERLAARRARARAMARALERAFAPRAELRALADADTIVCRCEDVRRGALRAEWSPRQAKLYTRAGMGACQGRVCGAALELLFGWPADTVRPPLEPALVSTLLAEPPGAPQPDASPAGGSPPLTEIIS